VRRTAPLAAALAILPLLAFGPAERVAPTHWAVVIGISDYINFDDVQGGDLPGAERDARSMRDVLVTRWGFPPDQVRMLLNREATRDAIEAAITDWLASNARPGDQVTIYFAGHGSQMWDEDGDEDDGLDETLAPADVSPTSTDFDISDDQFGAWLAELPTRNVVVFMDKCNSGTSTRDVTPFARPRQLGRDLSALERPPTASRRALPGQEDASGFDPAGTRVLELSASQPNQAAVDAFFPGEDGAEPFHGGAFTTFLVRELWRAPADLTYEQAFRRVADALRRNRFEQDPHLSAEVELKTLPLFFVEGGAGGAAEAVLPVHVGEDGAVLAGGGALGITAGSVFETEGGARLEVTHVERDLAHTRTLSGAASDGEGARMIGYRFPVTTTRVNVAGVSTATAEALAPLVADVPGLRLVDGEQDFAHLFLRRRAEQVRVVSTDGAVRAEYPTGQAGAEAIAAHLKREAAARRLGEVENPAQPFGLRVWLEGDAHSLGLGETVRFHAESERAGYLTLVDLGTDGTVSLLYPNPYDRDNHVEAGQRITWPTEKMDIVVEVQPPPGRSMVRAFVTPEPLDLPMGDDWVTGDVLLADRVVEALRRAAGSVEGAPDAVRLDTWASASVLYEIHR